MTCRKSLSGALIHSFSFQTSPLQRIYSISWSFKFPGNGHLCFVSCLLGINGERLLALSCSLVSWVLRFMSTLPRYCLSPYIYVCPSAHGDLFCQTIFLTFIWVSQLLGLQFYLKLIHIMFNTIWKQRRYIELKSKPFLFLDEIFVHSYFTNYRFLLEQERCIHTQIRTRTQF